MISFRDFVKEALKPSQYRPLVKDWNKEYLEDIFKNSPYEKDRNAYRLFIPLKGNTEGIKINGEIEAAIKEKGYEIDDYIGGYAIKGNRKVKIGKLLPNELKQTFANDPGRQAKSDYQMVVSRNPYDIGGMSTDRGWTSCQNLETGGKLCEFIPKDIKAGTIIAYMTKVGDNNLNSPSGRIVIKPYVNAKGETAYGTFKKVYGTVSKEFEKEVDTFVKWLNKQKGVKGIFKLHPDVYDDSDPLDDTESEKLVYITTNNLEKQIVSNPNSILKIDNPDEDLILMAVTQDPYLIGKIKNPPISAQIEAITQNPSLLKPLISNIRKNPVMEVQKKAISVEPSSIKFLKNPDEQIQLFAVGIKSSSIEHIDKPTEKVQISAIEDNPVNLLKIKNPTLAAKQLAASKL